MQNHRPGTRKIAWQVRHFLFVVGLLLALGRAATAQDQADPPGRVARLNYMQGSVSFQPAGTKDWVDANPNRPLTTGDNLWADENSRGELHIGSTALQVSSQTGISFLNLNDQATQIQLAQGVVDVHVRQLNPDEAFEIDTPNLAFSILRPGDYRVAVDPNGSSTLVDIRGGSGEVTGGGQAFNLNPGQRYAFSGTDQLSYDAQGLPGPDDFDNWCAQRDRREDHSASARYVSRDVTGYEDLDDYGSWSQDPQYGAVWIPAGVAVGWAPYHYGHWAYVAPWGWTWVEDEPWGFAPFHYGRWAVIGGGWAWVPGPLGVGVVVGGPVVRPVYAPALVGFVGGGGFGVSLAIGGGAGVAWFPLGPRDVWVPAYHCSPGYVQQVNITNTRVVNVTQVTTVYNNVYVNHTTVVNNYTYASNIHAVTAVNRDTFVSGRPVAQASVQITQEQIQHPQVTDRAAFQPTHQSMVGPNAPARNMPPAALANRPIVTKMTPAPQVTPIGHTQTLAASHAFKSAVAPGSNPRPQTIQPNQSNHGPANGNASGQSNNGSHPGFQSFSKNPNTGGNQNAPSNNAQPNNITHPTFQPPSHNNGNQNPQGNGNGSSNVQPKNVQPSNNPHPAFQPPSHTTNTDSNSNANHGDNTSANSTGKPNNTDHPAFQPPPKNQNATEAAHQNPQQEEKKPNKPTKDKEKEKEKEKDKENPKNQ